ncbi:DUF418 domain-containing protein [Brevibacterium pityocampae]
MGAREHGQLLGDGPRAGGGLHRRPWRDSRDVPHGIGLFLVGAHLFRAGIFEERGHRPRKRTMLLAFGIGLPIDWALRIFAADHASGITRYITSTAVAFGLLAAVAAFYANRTRAGWIGTPLAAVGRMALTCYILQNLLASIIFYDWGFGLAARLDEGSMTLWTMVVYVLLSAFLIGLSMLWLKHFACGPVEWLWDLGFRGIGSLLDRRQQRRAERSPGGRAAGAASYRLILGDSGPCAGPLFAGPASWRPVKRSIDE